MEEEKIYLKSEKRRAGIRRKSTNTKRNDDFTCISYNIEDVAVQNKDISWQNIDVNMGDNFSNNNTFAKSWENMIDVKSITNRLTCNQITSLIIEELGMEINHSFDFLKHLSSNNCTIVQQWSDLQHINDINNSFSERAPCEKLSPKQLKYVVHLIQDQTFNARSISRNLGVSRSLLYKIANMSYDDYERRIMKTTNRIHGLEKIALVQCIEIFIRNRVTPYNIKTFKILHSKSLEIFYGYDIVRDIMKNNLHLSFKRWKPRPNTINMQKLKLWRILFCIKFIWSLDSETLIANVDESTISRHSQLFYSWSQKGQPQEFKNTLFTGSINLVLTILSNGAWFFLLINQTMNSERFLSNIQSFKEWMLKITILGIKS